MTALNLLPPVKRCVWHFTIHYIVSHFTFAHQAEVVLKKNPFLFLFIVQEKPCVLPHICRRWVPHPLVKSFSNCEASIPRGVAEELKRKCAGRYCVRWRGHAGILKKMGSQFSSLSSWFGCSPTQKLQQVSSFNFFIIMCTTITVRLSLTMKILNLRPPPQWSIYMYKEEKHTSKSTKESKTK